jgi:hypothetical protein
LYGFGQFGESLRGGRGEDQRFAHGDTIVADALARKSSIRSERPTP